jgi:hypothetical protein
MRGDCYDSRETDMAAGYGKGDAMVRKAQSMIEPGVMDIRKGKTGAPVNPVPPAVVRQRRDTARMAKVNPPPPGYKKGGAVKMKAEGGTSKRGPRRDADGSRGAIRTMRNEREFMEMPEGTKQKHAMKSALGIQEKKKGGAVKKMKDGGTSKESSADMKQDKAVVRTAVHKHERAMHQGKPMTKLKKGGAAKSPCAAYKPKKMAAGGAAKERKDFPKVRRTKLTNAI